MSTGTDDFDELQRMLALKRCERPPRQFFNRFSDSVLHNLDAPERPETLSWLERLGVHFDVSPAVVGTIAVCVCALLAGGIAFVARTPPPAPPAPPDVNTVAVGTPPAGESTAGSRPKSMDPVLAPETSPINELNLPAPKAAAETDGGAR
jgi:hypothetical protein